MTSLGLSNGEKAQPHPGGLLARIYLDASLAGPGGHASEHVVHGVLEAAEAAEGADLLVPLLVGHGLAELALVGPRLGPELVTVRHRHHL